MYLDGDPGIYGMAGLIYEVLANQDWDPKLGLPVEVIPGVSALNSCASIVGSPLMTDFAVVSMSDLLVPWEIITKRVEAAALGDFVIVIYNPSSKKRIHQLQDTKTADGFSRECQVYALMSTFNFLRHGVTVDIFTGYEILYQIYIRLIPYYGITLFYCPSCTISHVIMMSTTPTMNNLPVMNYHPLPFCFLHDVPLQDILQGSLLCDLSLVDELG